MSALTSLAMTLIEAGASANNSDDVGAEYFAQLQAYGALALYSRSYRAKAVTQEETLARISPAGWENIYHRRDLGKADFLGRHARRASAAFTWSDVLLCSPAEQLARNSASEFGCADGLAIPYHGPDGYFGLTSVAFSRIEEIAPDELEAMAIAGLLLHGRMRELSGVPVQGPQLTRRERDALGFVADGKTDWEVANILGVSEATARFHVDNARRKLNASNRAHAVALALYAGLI